MKYQIIVILLLAHTLSHSQVRYDSVMQRISHVNKIKLCGVAAKGSVLRKHETFEYEVRKQLKAANLNLDSCSLSLEVKYEINCNSEVGNWTFKGKGDPNQIISNRNAALIFKIMEVLNSIKYFKSDADYPLLYALRISVNHGLINV